MEGFHRRVEGFDFPVEGFHFPVEGFHFPVGSASGRVGTSRGRGADTRLTREGEWKARRFHSPPRGEGEWEVGGGRLATGACNSRAAGARELTVFPSSSRPSPGSRGCVTPSYSKSSKSSFTSVKLRSAYEIRPYTWVRLMLRYMVVTCHDVRCTCNFMHHRVVC